MNKGIIIKDWADNTLFEGDYDNSEVLRIMKLNDAPNDDIFIYWLDEKQTENVYEYINF